MAKLRIFVSSTCYDFEILRSELRPFIIKMGYEPVMSDYSDILFDYRLHTHDSCIDEVRRCDMVIFIIGGRFGGEIKTPDKKSDTDGVMSITQAEIVTAIAAEIPIYAFVEEKVYHDHHVYEKNKNIPEIIDKIKFPSIQKQETAKHIFEFINSFTHRDRNNGLVSFSHLDEIRSHLIAQWSQLFQRLLNESKTKHEEESRYTDFSERIDDLKAIILTSLNNEELKAAAKGVTKHRHLIYFLYNLYIADNNGGSLAEFIDLLYSNKIWNDLLLSIADVTFPPKIISNNDDDVPQFRRNAYLIKNDNTFYLVNFPISLLYEYERNWEEFTNIKATDTKKAVIEAILEDDNSSKFRRVRYIAKDFDEYQQEKIAEINERTEKTSMIEW